MGILAFDEYVASLSRLTDHVDPTTPTPDSAAIKRAADSLASLATLDAASLEDWTRHHPHEVRVLGLAVGLSQEKLKNALKQHLGTAGWVKVASERPGDVVAMLDREFGLIDSLRVQTLRTYDFGDVLVARSGTRATARSATSVGRLLEDRVEAIAVELGLPYETRTRFQGKHQRTAPADLALPRGGKDARIVVAAKAFDSTGSKLTDAVREVMEMAEVQEGNQTVFAVIDGVGWLNRVSDLRKIHDLWVAGSIDGMFTASSLGGFKEALRRAAVYRRLVR